MSENLANDEVSFIIKAAYEVIHGRITPETFKAVITDYMDHLAIMNDVDQGTAETFKKSVVAGIKASANLIERGFIREEEHLPEERGYSYTLFFHNQIDENSLHEKKGATWILGRMPSVWRLRTIVNCLSYSRRDLIFDYSMEGDGIKFELSERNSVGALNYMFTNDQEGNLMTLLANNELKHKIVL